MFNYEYQPRGPLAPGMNVKFTVTFNCTSLEDVYEYITVVTKENKKTSFLIWAQNEAPVLKCKCPYQNFYIFFLLCFFFFLMINHTNLLFLHAIFYSRDDFKYLMSLQDQFCRESVNHRYLML